MIALVLFGVGLGAHRDRTVGDLEEPREPAIAVEPPDRAWARASVHAQSVRATIRQRRQLAARISRRPCVSVFTPAKRRMACRYWYTHVSVSDLQEPLCSLAGRFSAWKPLSRRPQRLSCIQARGATTALRIIRSA
jgi:hypothetical protein